MSKQQFKERIEKIESTRPQTNGPSVIVKAWFPNGKAPAYRGGKIRFVASNAGEINE